MIITTYDTLFKNILQFYQIITYYKQIRSMDVSYENLMQLLMAHRKEKQIPKFKTVPLKFCQGIQSSFQSLDYDLQQLFLKIFTKQQPYEIELKNILPFQQKKTAMPVCNKLLAPQQVVYRCYDCTTHQSAVLCFSCFQNGNHQGHRFTKIGSGGGNCDCGNPDAIAVQGFCKYHNGKGQQMLISQSQQIFFSKHMRQMVIWILKLYNNNETSIIAQQLLIHLIMFLDWLNTESLYYNTLTNKLLFNDKNQMINHIFFIGTKNRHNGLAKKATQLFLKMFSLEIFKENLAYTYLIAYNQLEHFQSTKFQALFIQLFANNDMVERVIQKHHISLDPRNREYNVYSYYLSLEFMSSIKPSAAKVFFTPLIQLGGVDLKLLDQIEQKCEKGDRPLEQFLQQGINIQNIYYNINKIIIKLIKDDKPLLKRQIQNKFMQITSHSFIKNKSILTYQRIFVVAIYAYFQFDYKNIEINPIINMLGIDIQTFKTFMIKLCEQFLICLNEFAKSLAYISFGRYSFQDYNDLYVRSSNGNMVILMDMLGIKFCTLVFQQLEEKELFLSIFLKLLTRQNHLQILNKIISQQQEQDQLGFSSSDKQMLQAPTLKTIKSSLLFTRQYISLINILIETTITNRPQITLSSQLQIKTQYISTLAELQFKKLLLNKKQLSLSQFDQMIKFWFKNPLQKQLILRYLHYDKNRKKYILKQQIKGIQYKKQYLVSLLKCSDNYIKKNQNINLLDLSLEITDSVHYYRMAIFPQGLVYKTYKILMGHIKILPCQEGVRELKNMISSIRLLENLLMGEEEVNGDVEEILQLMDRYFKKNDDFMKEIKGLLIKNKEGQAKTMLQNSQEQQLKRKQLLKKKRQEKLKNIKKNYNQQLIKKEHLNQCNRINEQQNQQICIYCHENSEQKPLFYLGSLFSSNIVYSILKIQGVNPYFQSCFHSIHNQCFIQCSKNKQKILCPLCKSISNILLMNDKQLKNKESLDIFKQKLQITLAQEYLFQFDNVFVEIVKSLIQFYFHRIINQKYNKNHKQIQIYKNIIIIIKQEYNHMQSKGQEQFIEELKALGEGYQKQSMNTYNFGLFVDIIINFLIAFINDQSIGFQMTNAIIAKSGDKISYRDLDIICNITKQLYSLHFQQQMLLDRSTSMPQHELNTYYQIFQPPKTITGLLMQKKVIQNQQICKLGHNICVCLICLWQGCLDCKKCYQHTVKFHNKDCIFFNYISGGLHHFYINAKVDIRSLYSNQLGQQWFPKYSEEEFYLQVELYNKLMDGLKNGNLAKTIRNNYQALKPSSLID